MFLFRTHLTFGSSKSLCLGVHALKAYGSRFVSVILSVILYVCNSLFILRDCYKLGTRKYRMGSVRQYLELNSLRFLN